MREYWFQFWLAVFGVGALIAVGSLPLLDAHVYWFATVLGLGIGIVGWALIEIAQGAPSEDKRDAEPKVPTLELGEPQSEVVGLYNKETGSSRGDVRIWRIPVTNVAEKTCAERTTIRLVKSEPPLPVLPVDLHRYHDDERPFDKRHDIRHGEPVIVDVIGRDVKMDRFYLWRSDLPAHYADYIYPLSDSEKQIVFDALLKDGMVITLRAVPDVPAKFVERSYRVFRGSNGQLAMETVKLARPDLVAVPPLVKKKPRPKLKAATSAPPPRPLSGRFARSVAGKEAAFLSLDLVDGSTFLGTDIVCSVRGPNGTYRARLQKGAFVITIGSDTSLHLRYPDEFPGAPPLQEGKYSVTWHALSPVFGPYNTIYNNPVGRIADDTFVVLPPPDEGE